MALAVHALARACTSLARMGVTFLARLVHHFVEQGVEEVQGSVGKLVGMVVHGGEGQREREQVWVHAMPRHGMVWSNGDDGLLQTLSMAFGRVPGVQRSTNDDLGWMVEAKTHWFV
jgi:hypothetical protein